MRGSGRILDFEGAINGARTRDPQLGKLMLYQLSYYRMHFALSMFLYCKFKHFFHIGQIYQQIFELSVVSFQFF